LDLVSTIAAKRDELILSRARPYLEEDEQVLNWVRARKHGTREDGFVYLTRRRLFVYWSRREDGHFTIPWEHISAWGLNYKGAKGPILAIESPEERADVELKVGTDGAARRVGDFLHAVGELAPIPRRALHTSGELGDVAQGDPSVERARRSVADHTRRVLVTVIGIALLVFAILIIPVPGPWSILLSIGGFALLASEYDWAQDIRDWIHDRYVQTKRRLQSRKRT
jgi:uncharacterized protein (TIGR02611 family)